MYYEYTYVLMIYDVGKYTFPHALPVSPQYYYSIFQCSCCF